MVFGSIDQFEILFLPDKGVIHYILPKQTNGMIDLFICLTEGGLNLVTIHIYYSGCGLIVAKRLNLAAFNLQLLTINIMGSSICPAIHSRRNKS